MIMKRLLALALSLVVASPVWGQPGPPPVVTATQAQTFQASSISAYGDSLTLGGQELTPTGPAWPAQLQADLGIPVVNYGIGGQGSTQVIMRAGAITPKLTFTSNQIAAFNSQFSGGTNITAVQSVALAGMNTGENPDYRFVATFGDDNYYYLTGTICGYHGRVKRNASGGPPSTSEIWEFQPDVAPPYFAVSCAAQSNFVPDSATNLGQSLVLWVGYNNRNNPSTVQSDIASMVSAQGNSNYVIIGIPTGDIAAQYTGNSDNLNIVATNSNSLSTYGATHYVDMIGWLASRATANVVDVLNVANGVTPYTQRALVGQGTLTTSINNSTTSVSLTKTYGYVQQYDTILIDGEYMYVSSISGSGSPYTLTVIRNYGTGGSAASHTNGAAFTAVDYVHLSGATDKAFGDYLAANYKSVLVPQSAASYVATPNGAGSPLGIAPPQIGGPNSITYYPGGIVVGSSPTGQNSAANTGTGIQLGQFGSYVAGVSGAGNQLLWLRMNGADNSGLVIGGFGMPNICLDPGLGDHTCAMLAQPNGLVQLNYGLQDTAYAYVQPVTTNTVTIADTADYAILDPAGTLAALTVVLPTCSATFDGKVAGFSSTQIVTVLTLSATAGSVATNSGLTALAAGQAATYVCRGANTTWYRRT